jgi:hypothetical protein
VNLRKLTSRTRPHATTIGAFAAPAAALVAAAVLGATVAPSAAAASPTSEAQAVAITAAAIAAPVEAAPAPAAGPAPAAPAPAPVAPSDAELHPAGVTADQVTFTPTVEQMSNAKAIVAAGQAMGLPPRAWVIAIATSLQEAQLKNLGNLGAANDHDSLGLFQQRPTSGWGTPEQIQDPTYAATAFYQGLVGVPGWQSLPLTKAAQKVQVSAYPDHYAKHEAQAGAMVSALYGVGPFAEIAKAV